MSLLTNDHVSMILKALLDCVVSLVFFFSPFKKISRVFDTNMFSILHYAKNTSWLRFFLRFGTFEVTETQTQHIV